MLIPFEKNGLWGYMNHEKKVILEPQFEEAFLTFNLVGRIKKNGKFGYINNEGKLIVKPIYDYAEDFKNGIAEVHKGNRSYFINTEGKKNKTFYATYGHHKHFSSPIIVTDSLLALNRYSLLQKVFLRLLISKVDSIYDIDAYLFIARKKNKIVMIEGSAVYGNVDSIINNLKYEYDAIKYFYCSSEDGGIKDHIGIQIKEHWGYYFIDPPFQIIEPKYLNIEAFDNEFGKVEYELNRFGYIDLQRNEYFYRNE